MKNLNDSTSDKEREIYSDPEESLNYDVFRDYCDYESNKKMIA